MLAEDISHAMDALLRIMARADIPEPPPPPPADVEAAKAAAIRAASLVKGQLFMARVGAGLTAREVGRAAGWSETTLRQVETREVDVMLSSLFRWAAGLRAAGVPGHIEVRYVRDPPPVQGDGATPSP